jgi:antitoxin MazE
LPANVAKAAHLAVDQMVRVTVDDGNVTISPVDGLEMTLEQRLALFDPARHGGEAMATAPVGAEKW